MAEKLRRLNEETWGERLHRAYRHCRALYSIPYIGHAEAISEFLPVSDQTLMRLEDYDELPPRPRQRQLVYLTCLAYGFDPEDFGLTPDLAGIGRGWNMAQVRKALNPATRRRPTASETTTKGDKATGGNSGRRPATNGRSSKNPPKNPSANNTGTSGHRRGIRRPAQRITAGHTTRAAA